MDWEACALYLLRDPRALDLVQEALSWYRALEPRSADTEARLLEHVGIVSYWHHEWERVLSYFTEALQMGAVVRDLERIGRIYHGLGVANLHLGNYKEASEVLGRARMLFGQELEVSTGPPVALAGVENHLALSLMYLGDLEQAEQTFSACFRHAEQAGLRDQMSHFVLSLAELRALQGRPDESLALVHQAIALGEEIGELTSVGHGHVQLAELHAARGEHARADAHFAVAVATFERAGYPRRLEECVQKWQALRAGREPA